MPNHRMITACGRTMDSRSWALHLGISPAAFHWRLQNWGEERAICGGPPDPVRSRSGRMPKRLAPMALGVAPSLAALARRLKMPRQTLRTQLERWGLEKTMERAPLVRERRWKRTIHFNGEDDNLSGWARLLGFSRQALSRRLARSGERRGMELAFMEAERRGLIRVCPVCGLRGEHECLMPVEYYGEQGEWL